MTKKEDNAKPNLRMMGYRFLREGSLDIPNGIEKSVPQPDGSQIIFQAYEIRYERSGTHALVAILYRDDRGESYILGHDTLNVGKNEERVRLSRSSFSFLPETTQAIYSEKLLRRDLDIFCLGLDSVWQERITATPIDGSNAPEGISYTLKPLIIEGGGTAIFSPPGQGKSYLALLMAQSINSGISHLWEVEQRKVLYINLERSARSMEWRMLGVNRALGLLPGSYLDFLNARGESLQNLERVVRQLIHTNGYQIIVLDSISRTAMTSLTQDVTANNVMNLLNSLSQTWLAIGHSPREDKDHIYGSQMFDAAMDIGVKLSSQRKEDSLGVVLSIKKANDIKIPKPIVLALRFGKAEEGLIDVQTSSFREYPDLAEVQSGNKAEQIQEYLLMVGKATTSEIAEALGMEPSNVSRILRAGEQFICLGRVGEDKKLVYYAIATKQENTRD